MIRRLLLDWRFYVAVAVITTALALCWGLYAAAGWALGLVGTFASVMGTWAAVKLMSGAAPGEEQSGFDRLVFGFIFLTKLPVFFGAIFIAMRLPDPGLAAFGFGMLLVYSALVGWAQAKA